MNRCAESNHFAVDMINPGLAIVYTGLNRLSKERAWCPWCAHLSERISFRYHRTAFEWSIVLRPRTCSKCRRYLHLHSLPNMQQAEIRTV